MTTYRVIAATETDPDSPVTSTLVIALADNPTSIAEGAVTAPPNQSGWHPFDQLFIGDGNTGVIYDFAVDGLVGEVDSPDFEVGFEYRFIADGIDSDSGTIGIQILGFLTTDAVFESFLSLLSATLGTFVGYDFVISPPMTVRDFHMVQGIEILNINATAVEIIGGVDGVAPQTVTRVRHNMVTGNFSAGTIYMFRRRIDYAN